MPSATTHIIYLGAMDEVDAPTAGLFAVQRSVPVKVGRQAADLILTHPDWQEACLDIDAADTETPAEG